MILTALCIYIVIGAVTVLGAEIYYGIKTGQWFDGPNWRVELIVMLFVTLTWPATGYGFVVECIECARLWKEL